MVSRTRDIILTLCDVHVPFHDKKAVSVAMDFAKDLVPKTIVMHEWLDWYQISKFDKDPNRINDLQDDIDQTVELFDALRRKCKGSDIIMVKSNHDARLERYKRQNQPLYNLRNLNIEKLLELEKFNIHYQDDYVFRKVLFKHGNTVRKYSGYTAKNELNNEGISGASGHTHRLGCHYETNRGGKYVWMESGCLCDLKPEYIDGIANWQHGCSVFLFKKNSNHFSATVVPIIDHEILWGAESYAA